MYCIENRTGCCGDTKDCPTPMQNWWFYLAIALALVAKKKKA